MKNTTQFQSECYIKVYWHDLFIQAGAYILQSNRKFGLVNSTGIAMIPNNFVLSDRIVLYCQNKIETLLLSELTPVANLFLKNSGISYFRLNNYYHELSYSDIYVQFVKKIILNVSDVFNSIFNYTYKHLSKRHYDHKIISSIESVQNQFINCAILFEKTRNLLSSNIQLSQIQFIISKLLDALNILSKLGGARAVLKNNVIELMFHLKMFEKFIYGHLESFQKVHF